MKEKEQDIKIFQSFGCEDSVYNHLNMLVDIDNGKKTLTDARSDLGNLLHNKY